MYVSNSSTSSYSNSSVTATNTRTKAAAQTYQPSNENNELLYACGDMSGNGIWVRYDESSTNDNPVMSVKVVSKGQKTEVKINPREINPAKASAAEMAALIAYSGAKGDKQSLNPAMIRIIQDNDNLLEQQNMSGIIKSYADNSLNRQSYSDLLSVIDTFLSRNAEKSKSNNSKMQNIANYNMCAEQFLMVKNAFNNENS